MLVKAKLMSASQLLGLNGRDFVEECYRQILLREPDPQGVATYLTRVSSGHDRLDIAADIASSDEAREKARNRASLAADILGMHAEQLVANAWTPSRRKSAARRVRRYLAVLSGRPGPSESQEAFATSDPFCDYLRDVIQNHK